jgi:ParB family chromosome partitioning protein
VKLKPTDLTPIQLAISLADRSPALDDLARAIEADGGAVLAAYREPLGGNALLFAALPVEKVERTSFQRDVSDTHVRRLTQAMDKTRRYLDPIIAIREGGKYLTPNGGHRLTAVKELGAVSILALVVPERAVAYQILALNIEKAHNLREKAQEVVRMFRDLAGSLDPRESDMALEFEEPAFVTLGFGYEARPRLSGGAYHSVLKKVDGFLDKPLSKRSCCWSSTTRWSRRWDGSRSAASTRHI